MEETKVIGTDAEEAEVAKILEGLAAKERTTETMPVGPCPHPNGTCHLCTEACI